jgi:hypothetical protein
MLSKKVNFIWAAIFCAISFLNVAAQSIQLFQFLQGNHHRNTNIIGHVEQIIQNEFSTVQGVLPLGVYKVIPHMLIHHETIPEALLRSLGTSFEEPGVEYLNIPMRRNGGLFEVKSQ